MLTADLVVEAVAATVQAKLDENPHAKGTVATYTVAPRSVVKEDSDVLVHALGCVLVDSTESVEEAPLVD